MEICFAYFSAKRMFWVLKRTVSKHMSKLSVKKIIAKIMLKSTYLDQCWTAFVT